MRWLWSQADQQSFTDKSYQAVEDSQLILDTARARWDRVNRAGDRAERAREQVRSQREQNHLAEIVHIALGGKRT